MIKRISLLLAVCVFMQTHARTVGSYVGVARHGRAYFKNEIKNEMLGFSVFKNGIILADENTTCLFKAYFPVSGDIILNQGTVSLQSDLTFQNPLGLSAGTIDGNLFSVILPHNVTTMYLPSLHHERVLMEIESFSHAGYKSHTCDWSYDSKYLAIAFYGTPSKIEIYELLDENLILRATQELTNNNYIRSLQWNPTSYYFAIGTNQANELQTWIFNPGGPSITLVDGENVGSVVEVSWSKDGNFLAVAQASTSQLYVYPVSSGVFGDVVTGNIGVTASCYSVDWSSTGTYLALGMLSNSGSQELKIFSFDGSTLDINAQAEIGHHVYSVRWRPNDSILAVGISTKSEQLETYQHTSGVLSRIDGALVGETQTVYKVDWTDDGNYLAVAKYLDTNGLEIELLYYDAVNQDYSLVSGYSLASRAYVVSWSPDGNYLVATEQNGKIHLFKMDYAPLNFNDTRIVCDAPVVVTSGIQFTGSCVLNGNGNSIDFSSTGSFIIAEGASLVIQNAVLKNLTGAKVACKDNTGLLVLRDVIWMQDNDTRFDYGSIIFDNTVKMMGQSVFAYHTNQTSTINFDSQLILSMGITFSYDPLDSLSNKGIAFEDSSASLLLHDCSLVTTYTMVFTKGTLEVMDYPAIGSYQTDGSNFIQFGDDDNGFDIIIHPARELIITQGEVRYKNQNVASLIMEGVTSSIRVMPSAKFKLFENCDVSPGRIIFEADSKLERAIGKNIIGSVVPLGNFINLPFIP